jgi:hypothetical protein|tara:strand:- start:1452 stop:2144 length:693 start_codon:yes stop_codon:yes gene_type:complete
MAQVKLDTKKDIKSFFKILAEESIKEAHRKINEGNHEDPAAARLDYQKSADKKAYSNILEQEVDKKSTEKEVSKPSPKDNNLEPEEIEVSLDSVGDAIKRLRSGRSIDDSAVKDQTRAYFDRLSDPERRAMLAFMRAFADILTGAVDGASAPDPSEPPYSVGFEEKPTDDDKSKKISTVSQEEELGLEDEEVEEEEEEDEEGEDTSPPIKVGTPQSLKEIRKKVQHLIRR